MKNNLINKNNLRVLLIGTIILLIATFFGAFFYFFELFSHFYLQYLTGVIILFGFSIYLKDKISIIISSLLIFYLGVFVIQASIFQKDIEKEVDLYYLNANFFIQNPESIINDIKKYNPEYVAIIELNPNLYKNIKEKLNYKNEIYFNSGVASYGFFTNKDILFSKTHELSYPIGEIKIEETDILLVHPLPGLNKNLHSLQKKNFEEITKIFGEIKSDKKMIIGDFNSSFYSLLFRKHFGDLYYKPIYSRNIKGILRLPIDYAIGNKRFYNIYRSNLETSDHTPLLIKFQS